MSKFKIFQFELYNITTDAMAKSRRWATREMIERLGGKILEETAVDVDSSMVGREIDGMTDRGFNPHWQTGFQRQVTS